MAEEQLSAQQRSKIRRLSQPKELTVDEEGGELNVVPFLDIVMNVLIFVLATIAVNFIATIEAPPPRQSNRINSNNDPDKPQLQLTIAVTDDGFSVLGSGSQFKLGDNGKCVPAGAAKTGIPKIVVEGESSYDYANLTSCVRSLKCGEVTKCETDDECGAPEVCTHKDAKGNLDGLDCSNHTATGATCVPDASGTQGICSRCDSHYSKTCFTCNGQFASEKSVTLTTDDPRTYQVLIHTLDAVRKQGAVDLFTEINFARLAGN